LFKCVIDCLNVIFVQLMTTGNKPSTAETKVNNAAGSVPLKIH